MRGSRLPAGGVNVLQEVRAKRLDASGKGVRLLDLSIGEPKGPALQSASEAAAIAVKSRDEAMHCYQYNDSPGVPGFAKRFVELAEEHDLGLLSRVPHASNTLTGEYDHGLPVFDADDHRAHRKNEWLEESMRKVNRVRFLVQEDTRTMAQSAIQFVLKQKAIVSVLPNFTKMSELKEYTGALETPEITDEEQSKLDELWEHDFDLAEPEPQFREI